MIKLGLGNYYGEVVAVENNGEYYLQLENYNGTNEVKISKALYETIKKEFGNISSDEPQ